MFEQQKLRDLMGESKKEVLRVQFDPSVKMEFHGAKLTSDGGLIVYRELDEVLGLTTLAEEVLTGFAHGSEHPAHADGVASPGGLWTASRIRRYQRCRASTGRSRTATDSWWPGQGTCGGFDQPDEPI